MSNLTTIQIWSDAIRVIVIGSALIGAVTALCLSYYEFVLDHPYLYPSF